MVVPTANTEIAPAERYMGAASTRETGDLVETMRRITKPESANRLANSLCVRVRALPNITIICTSSK
jgi:hypothetical protein